MTYGATSGGRRPAPPSRWWYVVALAIAGFGIWGPSLVGGLMFDAAYMEEWFEEQMGRLTRVVVPGEVTLALAEQDTYTIFHEYWSVVDGRVFAPAEIEGLTIEVRRLDTDEPVPVQESSAWLIANYTDDDRVGEAMFEFDVARPGSYRLMAYYGDGRDQPQSVLAIGNLSYSAGILTLMVLALAGVVAVVVAIVMAVVVFIRRRRAKAALAHGP